MADPSASWLTRGGSDLLDTARRRLDTASASVKDLTRGVSGLLNDTAANLRERIPFGQHANNADAAAASSSSDEDVVLRESEALLALLQHATSEGGSSSDSNIGSSGGSGGGTSASAAGSRIASSSLTPSVSSTSAMVSSTPGAFEAGAERLVAAAALDDGGRQLRDELAVFVSNAQLPLGADLCQFVADFRSSRAAANAANASSTSPAAAAAPAASPLGTTSSATAAAQQLPQRLWQSISQRGRLWADASRAASPAAMLLLDAVKEVHAGRERLLATLDEQLPHGLREEQRVVREALKQLDAALHRALFPPLTPLYLQAFDGDIGRLAQRCHDLRMLLPCDMNQLPLELWLLPAAPAAAAAATTATATATAIVGSANLAEKEEEEEESAAVAHLRWCGSADPRLPYASAIQLLRTISFYRTPSEKANVLLEACEEVVKCATRALSLSSAGRDRGGDHQTSHHHQTPAGSQPPSKLGADDLLPLVVYVLVRSGVYNMPAELQYVADFLHEGFLHGKEGYALVSMQCACRVAADLTWGAGLLRARPPSCSSADAVGVS